MSSAFLLSFFFFFYVFLLIWKGHYCKEQFRLLNTDKGLNMAKGHTTLISYSRAIIENIKACSL